MKNYQYYWWLLKKYKYVYSFIICLSILCAIIFLKNETPLYKSETEIYPLLLQKESKMTRLNPCYTIKRIAHSKHFQQMLINSNISPTLSEKNYNQRIEYHETPRHTLNISIKAETPELADSLAWLFIFQLDSAILQLKSMQLAIKEHLTESIPWENYHMQINFVQEDSLKSITEVDSQFFLFDLISAPCSSKENICPPNYLKTIILVFVISSFLSLIGIFLAEELKELFGKHK